MSFHSLSFSIHSALRCLNSNMWALLNIALTRFILRVEEVKDGRTSVIPIQVRDTMTSSMTLELLPLPVEPGTLDFRIDL